MKPDFKENLLENTLTINEKAEFETLEDTIKREMGSFIAVGNALQTIRDQRLYREEFKTFKDYCNEKWGIGKAHANRLIGGSRVAANLAPRGALCTPCEIQPTNEAQVRPLTVLEPAQQCEVWEEAVRSADGKTITYKQIKSLVAELIGPAAPSPPKKKDPYAHSDANYFVSLAMMNLEKIRDDDPLRVEAVGRIAEWIQEKLNIWTEGE
jgi:hypothetical protein